jgi:hypothetical protein
LQLYAVWLPGLGVTPLPAGALVMLDVVALYPGD